MHDLVLAGLTEHEVDTLLGRLLRHELRLRSVGRVDEFVFSIFVAVGARKVTLVGDVHHHRRQRERLERYHLRD